MRTDEVEDSIKESYALAQTFQTIGDFLKKEILTIYASNRLRSNISF